MRVPLELHPVGRAAVRLAVDGGRLVGYRRRGRPVELGSARTLWIFRWQGRDCLAVLDRHGAGLLTIEAPFCPYRARAFADRYGFALWLGVLSETEPRLRLAGVRRLRAALTWPRPLPRPRPRPRRRPRPPRALDAEPDSAPVSVWLRVQRRLLNSRPAHG
jgi:hypothetical protein